MLVGKGELTSPDSEERTGETRKAYMKTHDI